MTQANNPKSNPGLSWFDKIQNDIASSAGILASSTALAQQAAELSDSMQLAAKPFIEFESSGAMQMLKQAQEAANRVSVNLKMYDDQTLKIAEAMRNSTAVGIDPQKWQQITGLTTSIDAVTKFNMPLANISALTEASRIVPPPSMFEGINIPAMDHVPIAGKSFVEKAMVPKGLTESIELATKHLTASQQLLEQMQNVSTGMKAALEGTSVALPGFEKYLEVSKIVGEHYRPPNIDSVLRGFEQLEQELNLDIPVETTDDIDDLVEDAKAIEFVENQITENGALKPSISQVLFGFDINDITTDQRNSLFAFGGSVAVYLYETLGTLLDENVTAARFFAVAIIFFLPVYSTAMVADAEIAKGPSAA